MKESRKISTIEESELDVNFVRTLAEFENQLQEHEISTATKYILLKSCKKFREKAPEISNNMRLHWQGATPFYHLGSKLYKCHQGKDNNINKKKKYIEERKAKATPMPYKKFPKSKKVDCPAGFTVTRVLRFSDHKITKITKKRKKIMSTKIREAVSSNPNFGEEGYTFRFPRIEEHAFHLVGQTEGVAEPVDDRIRKYIEELVYKGMTNADVVMRMSEKFSLEVLRECERRRKRFFPDKKTVHNIMYAAKSKVQHSPERSLSPLIIGIDDHDCLFSPTQTKVIDNPTPQTPTQDSEKQEFIRPPNEITENKNVKELPDKVCNKNTLVSNCQVTLKSIETSLWNLSEISLQQLKETLTDIYDQICSVIASEISNGLQNQFNSIDNQIQLAQIREKETFGLHTKNGDPKNHEQLTESYEGQTCALQVQTFQEKSCELQTQNLENENYELQTENSGKKNCRINSETLETQDCELENKILEREISRLQTENMEDDNCVLPTAETLRRGQVVILEVLPQQEGQVFYIV